MKIKIAVVQLTMIPRNPEANLEKAKNYVKQAAEANANIVVFPESFVAGIGPSAVEFADEDFSYRKAFQELAKKNSIDIVPGSFLEKEDGKLWNTTYYIDSKGTLLAQYRKVNLWHSEMPQATRGKKPIVVDTKWGKVGLAICWDLAFPELFRKMFVQGAEIIFCPSFWSYQDAGSGIQYNHNAEIDFVNALCTARAFENEIIMVFSNIAGEWQNSRGDFSSIGHSQITIPFIGRKAVLAHNKEEMLITDVDTAILKEAEEAYKIRENGELTRVNEQA